MARACGLLQHKPRRIRRPRDRGVAGSRGNNRERRRTGDLDRRGQRPESARDRILRIGHVVARVVLTNGAADGINAASARAATACNRRRGDRVLSVSS